MDIKIEKDEVIEDLGIQGLKIIQNKKEFCFGIDSVLLSDFAKNLKKDSIVLDLGTGSGIIATLLCAKTKLKKIYGVEIQKAVSNRAKRSIKLNNLENKFVIIEENIINLQNYFNNDTFDVIVTNPPYKEKSTGIKNINEQKYISRHEVTASLEEFIKISQKLLKSNGEFYMVHRPERLVDIFFYLRKYKLEPKEIQFVKGDIEKEPKLILIKAIKNGKHFLKKKKDYFNKKLLYKK